MDYISFAERIDLDYIYNIYFFKEKVAYDLFGPVVTGKLILPKLSVSSTEILSNYILVKIDAIKAPHVNEGLNPSYFEILKTHGVIWWNIDFHRTLGIS